MIGAGEDACTVEKPVCGDRHEHELPKHRRGLKNRYALFKPRFMLGMTATPARNDDFNVYDFFDNNIAYQITLQRA